MGSMLGRLTKILKETAERIRNCEAELTHIYENLPEFMQAFGKGMSQQEFNNMMIKLKVALAMKTIRDGLKRGKTGKMDVEER